MLAVTSVEGVSKLRVDNVANPETYAAMGAFNKMHESSEYMRALQALNEKQIRKLMKEC